MNKNIIIKNISTGELRYGFLRTNAVIEELLPKDKSRIDFNIHGKKVSLMYTPQYRRVFGLTTWYRKYNVSTSDQVIIEKKRSSFKLEFKSKKIQ